MAKICLVSCASKKLDREAPAQEMYISSLFEKQKSYAIERCDSWYILSAKHGLLKPSQIIKPYDQTLNAMPVDERRRWAVSVWKSLSVLLNKGDEIYILAGSRYREFLVPLLEESGFSAGVPFEGLSIGRQMQHLSALTLGGRRACDLDKFYSIMNKQVAMLGGYRSLRERSSGIKLPGRGVYFFFEPGEKRYFTDMPRVVRVGTHAVSRGARSSLWGRLRTHRGSLDGSGNHRSSVFRLHVGAALKNRSPELQGLTTWGMGQSATEAIRRAEASLERMVSEYIGSMSFLYIRVDDEPGPRSDRSYIERNSIAILAGAFGPFDPASSSWLGNYSSHSSIRAGGLWNVDFSAKYYDPRFLEVLEAYMDVTLGKKSPPLGSIAPSDWDLAGKSQGKKGQLGLFGES